MVANERLRISFFHPGNATSRALAGRSYLHRCHREWGIERELTLMQGLGTVANNEPPVILDV